MPSSGSGSRAVVHRISRLFYGSHPNTDESSQSQERPEQGIIADYEPAVVDVPEGRDNQVSFASVFVFL